MVYSHPGMQAAACLLCAHMAFLQYVHLKRVREREREGGWESQLFGVSSFSINLCIYLFLAALGLCCCMQAFSSCEQGLLFLAVCRLLIVVAFLVAKHGL